MSIAAAFAGRAQQMPEGIRVQSDGKEADQLLNGTIGTLYFEYLKWFRAADMGAVAHYCVICCRL
mgnify:CR=1 FL=1|tara:strand:+ start:694 stop:888 length:195 start_codon:yes stop_codon:yes gene_type:complete